MFVGLQRIQHPQCFIWVTTDVETICRDMLDNIVRINNESCMIIDALFRVEDAERFRHRKSAFASCSSDLRQAKWKWLESVEAPIKRWR